MFAKIINNEIVEYPLVEPNIKAAFPNISFPLDLSNSLPDGYVKVISTPKPLAVGKFQSVSEVTPIISEGQWTQKWEITIDTNK